mgnify:CR=1 FL=1
MSGAPKGQSEGQNQGQGQAQNPSQGTEQGQDQAQRGAALLRKLIIRRLTTTPGDFFHLPKYGVGLKVKQPIPAGNLVRFRTLVERELLLEPDLAQVAVAITQSSNILTIQVRAVLTKSGQQVSVGLLAPIG